MSSETRRRATGSARRAPAAPPTDSVCILGPIDSGPHRRVVAQAEILAARLVADGWTVRVSSRARSRFARLADMVWTALRPGAGVRTLCIQVYSGHAFAVAAVLVVLGRAMGRRVVAVLRGGGLGDLFRRRPLASRLVLGRAHALVAPSDFLVRAARELGLAAERIPNIVDVESYPHRLRSGLRPSLLWMRSFHPIYNPDLAVRVFDRIRREYPDARLVMAGGDAGSLDDVGARVRAMGLGSAITLPGFLDTEDKERLFSSADIFLNTNRVDNMPVSVVEACAFGLPVVATEVGGIGDLLVDGHTGLLVPDDDDEAMAAAVLRLLREPDLARRLSENGRRVAERSSWRAAGPRWRAVLGGRESSAS